MLCSRYLKVEAGGTHGRLHQRITRSLESMEATYELAIGWSLRHRWAVVGAAIGIVALTPFIFSTLGGEFFPAEDEGQFQITLRTPAGSSLEYSDERMQRIEELVLAHPEIKSVFATLGGGRTGGVNNGLMYVNMQPRGERKITQTEMIRILRDELAQVPGIVAFPAPFGISGSSRGDALSFVLQGPDLETTAQLSREFRDRLSRRPELGQIDLDLELDLPQVRLEVNRDLAAEFGLTSRTVAEAANILAGGFNVAKFSDEPGDGERYDIRLKAAGDVDLQDLSKIYLRSPAGELIRLDTVARFTELAGAATITRVDRQYAATFFSDPTISLGEAVDLVRKEAGDFLPPGYTLKLQGGSEQLENTSSGIGLIFLLALLLVYGVLASQFNSYLQPLIIMVAQPLAIIGGVAALAITGNTLNLYSIVGLILLIGLVAKNSILLVDLTNQLREQGRTVDDALAEACPRRLRPILMTSLTIIFAMLVPALGFGTGVELSGPLSVAVIGGMISSTLLTLVVVPAVYSLVESGRQRESRFSPRAWLAKLPLPGRAGP
jgi:HAE1 family hydrophobic/amphiphilic exporter-1